MPAAWLAARFRVAETRSALVPAAVIELVAPRLLWNVVTVIVADDGLVIVIGATGRVIANVALGVPVIANTPDLAGAPTVKRVAPPVTVRPSE